MKASFLHGFLGSPNDMLPFFIPGVENQSIDLRKIFFKENVLSALTEEIKDSEILIGYSFGGRLLGELKEQGVLKNKKWIFISSRHSPYEDSELQEREEFRSKLIDLIQTDLKLFYKFWNNLPLFSGHKMSDFRDKYAYSYKPWSADEMLHYLDVHFNSLQFMPKQDSDVYYLHGEKDVKYSKEAQKLNSIFKTYNVKGVGHRLLFENVESFNEILRRICGF